MLVTTPIQILSKQKIIGRKGGATTNIRED